MALIERIEKTTEATTWPGQIPLTYRYTAGRAGERFLRLLKDEGKLLGARCEACGVTYVPAAIFCERCLGRIEETTVELEPRGSVHSFTVCHEQYDGARKETPSVVALIAIDGADTVLVHRLDVPPAEARIGMRVEAKLAPETERRGSILDILHFSPAAG